MLGNRAAMLAIALFLGVAPVQGVCAKTAEEALKARHQELLAAYNKRDVKALRRFYTAEYRYEERGGHQITLDRYLKGFDEMFKILPKPGQDKATLTQLVLKNDTATAVELRMVQGVSGTSSGPAKTAQTWKKVGGLWKLAREKEMKD